MKPGLVTLADLPAPAAGKNRTTIVVARLDDNLRDPRYGSFKITQDDVDGWKRNLTGVFGGRVAIDYDHSSDRGGGTRAAAWITGLHRDGKLITADVEFTPRGAKSIRNGDYRYISPTFVANYSDEHGQKHGKALIGAALTNRPVLRAGMPCLSLSRDPFDGVATARKRKKGRQMNKVSNQELVTLSRSTDRKEIVRGLKRLSSKQRRKLVDMTLANGAAAGLSRAPAISGLSPETAITLAQFAPDGVQHAGMVDWQPPATDAGRVPLGLDDAGRALHGLIANRAASTGTHYFDAMAAVTGQPGYAALSDIPPALVQQQGLDAQQAAKYTAGRALAIRAGIGWMDAMAYIDHLAALNQLEAGTGAGDAPWLDTRPLATPPRPWSDEDWARDQRRANAAGVDVDRDAWQAGAEQGMDLVGQLADANRADAIATHRARGEGLLDQARAAEDSRRSSAINDELTRRARARVAGNGRMP